MIFNKNLIIKYKFLIKMFTKNIQNKEFLYKKSLKTSFVYIIIIKDLENKHFI